MARDWTDDERDEPDDEAPAGPGMPAPGADEQPEEDLEINGYRLVRELQRGGQAAVFLAVQKSTGRKVALKLMFGGPFAAAIEKQRMDQEVRILAALDHPNIVSVIDRGETADGSQYFVTNFVDGRSLNEFLDDYRRDHGAPRRNADVTELLHVFKRICEAVNAAHLRGIVHRDLKPANIIIDAYGEPHILDFGLAHAALASGGSPEGSPTRTGEFVGSLEWASPEQARGEASQIDTRTDVYALGVILYEMLTGDFPYDVFGELRDVLDHIVKTRPPAPSRILGDGDAAGAPPAAPPKTTVDDALDAIVLKALAKSRDERHQTAGELARDVGQYLEGHRPAPRAAGHLRRNVLIGTLVGLLAGAGAFYLRQTTARRPEPPQVPYDQGVYGYTVAGPNLIFIFEPARYEAVRHEDGRLDTMEAVGEVDHVSVVGAFNDWQRDTGEWMMHPVARGRFELRKPLTQFAGRTEWPFKFLVNGEVWVGAPASAVNREVVVTDTATFNLVLLNPAGGEETATRVYRDQINRAWPGQGANLALDEKSRLHFTFTHLPPGVRVTDLDPLRGIPLASLDLGESKVTDLSPLKDMATLQRLHLSDGTFAALIAPVMTAVRAYNLDAAEQALADVFGPLSGVPAFATARDSIADALATLRALKERPDQRPPQAKTFGGHPYALILLPMNWNDARFFAERSGGHLAAVTSAEENQWIAETFGQACLGRTLWLGGTDEGTESYWRWLSGEGWRYEHWNKPEPNNNNGNEHALAVKPDGWWIDADGYSLQLPFVIEWSK